MSQKESAGTLLRSDAAASEALVRDLFEPTVRIGIAPVRDELADLSAAERALVEGAVRTRKNEFATGRRLAHRLLAELGVAAGPILRDADRVPIWPEGIVGSISHSRTLAVAALARAAHGSGIGIDIEPDVAVRDGVERVVCTPFEQTWLDSAPSITPSDPDPRSDRARWVKLFFSAKESVYKAFFPRIRVFWGFHEVELEIDPVAGRFDASLPASADRQRITGRFARKDGVIVSGVLVD